MAVYLGSNPVSVYNGGQNAVKLQEKTVTPTTSIQNITPDENYDGLSKVIINSTEDISSEIAQVQTLLADIDTALDGKASTV